MISISTIFADLTGSIIINNTSKCDFTQMPARVSRIATLDLGAVIVHSGISEGDRTFFIDCDVSEIQKNRLTYIFSVSTIILVSCLEGLFIGTLSDFEIKNGQFKTKILIKSKEN